MVDYSQWLESVNRDPIQWVASLGIAVLLVAGSIFIARMGERIEGVIRGIFVLGSMVLVVGLVGGLYLAFCQPPKDNTFARGDGARVRSGTDRLRRRLPRLRAAG